MSRPLTVAIVAMALLVVSVGFEVVFHRTYALDVSTEGGWVTIGATGTEPYRMAKPAETMGGAIVEANRTSNLTFRLRVVNDYPWSMSEAYDVRVGGVIVSEGVLAAAASSEGESTFQVRAGLFLAQRAPQPAEPRDVEFAYVDVQIDEAYMSGSFQLREVS